MHIILVHGLGATEKSWFDLPEALTVRGHTAVAVRLPGEFTSGLDDFVEAIVAAFPTTGESVLIGHSMGGVSISQAAADHPGRVSKLVYVAALVPDIGESAGSIIGGLSSTFDNVLKEFERLGIGLDHPARRVPVLGALRGRFSPSPGFEIIPKYYVRCSSDTIIPPLEQDNMIAKWPVMSEYKIQSGHIPQKEAPNELARSILDAVG